MKELSYNKIRLIKCKPFKNNYKIFKMLKITNKIKQNFRIKKIFIMIIIF